MTPYACSKKLVYKVLFTRYRKDNKIKFSNDNIKQPVASCILQRVFSRIPSKITKKFPLLALLSCGSRAGLRKSQFFSFIALCSSPRRAGFLLAPIAVFSTTTSFMSAENIVQKSVNVGSTHKVVYLLTKGENSLLLC